MKNLIYLYLAISVLSVDLSHKETTGDMFIKKERITRNFLNDRENEGIEEIEQDKSNQNVNLKRNSSEKKAGFKVETEELNKKSEEQKILSNKIHTSHKSNVQIENSKKENEIVKTKENKDKTNEKLNNLNKLSTSNHKEEIKISSLSKAIKPSIKSNNTKAKGKHLPDKTKTSTATISTQKALNQDHTTGSKIQKGEIWKEKILYESSKQAHSKEETNKSKDQKQRDIFKAKCLARFGNNFYDLADIEDFKVKPVGTEDSFYINLCRNNQGEKGCSKSGLAMNKKTCTVLAGDHKEEKSWVLDYVNKSIDIYFPPGEMCEYNPGQKYRLLVRAVCDKSVEGTAVEEVTGFDSCNPKLTIRSKSACKDFTYNNWVEDIGIHKAFLITFFLTVGVTFLILGNLFKLFYGMLVISLMGGLFLITLLQEQTGLPAYSFFLFTTLVGLILICFEDALLYALQLILGLIVGTLFYDVLLNTFDIESDVAYYISLITFSVIFLILKKQMERSITIVNTSLLGAYLIIRSFSLFQDNFPDEYYIYILFHHNEGKQINRIITNNLVVYIGAMLVLFLVGILIQFGQKEYDFSDKDKSDSEESERNEKLAL